MEWSTKRSVNRAGKCLTQNDFSKMSREEAIKAVQLWREKHSSVLINVYQQASKKAKKYGATATSKKKRMTSIIKK